MRLSPPIGLRGRIVAALVTTSAVTLIVAAVALLSPLERRLRREDVEQLRSSAAATKVSFRRLDAGEVKRGSAELAAVVRALGRRTDARVVVLDGRGRLLAATDIEPRERFPLAATALRRDRVDAGTTSVGEGDQAEVAVPVDVDGRRIVVILRRSLRDTTTAVSAVKPAFARAAVIGLAVAVVLGLAISFGLVRRLRRLRDTTLRVAEQGPGAALLSDSSHDEVGDLTRSFATMQSQLQRQEQARRTFVSTASHELRTPLAALRLMLDGLAEDLDGASPDVTSARHQALRAQNQSRRLARLAEELLELSRVDAGLPLREDLVEIGEVCRAVVAEFEERASAEGLRIDCSVSGPAWAVADPGGVARIVRILIDNALRFSPPDDVVGVSVQARGEGPVLRVVDHGSGVPEQERNRIFERFARGTETDADGGFGLGLAIGRAVAEGMQGELVLERAERGAVFALRLRPAPAQDMHPLERSPGDAERERRE